MTIGVFDGVHRGHAELLRRIVEHGPNPTVLTFRENPKKYTAPRAWEGDIISLEERLARIEALGIHRVILIDFSGGFSIIRAQEFLSLLAEPGGMVFLAIGSNFHCGYRKEYAAEDIKRFNEARGIPTDIVPPLLYEGEAVSSSRIRAAIKAGRIAEAEALTGHEVCNS
jgi:cytidyltransferase-like protein